MSPSNMNGKRNHLFLLSYLNLDNYRWLILLIDNRIKFNRSIEFLKFYCFIYIYYFELLYRMLGLVQLHRQLDGHNYLRLQEWKANGRRLEDGHHDCWIRPWIPLNRFGILIVISSFLFVLLLACWLSKDVQKYIQTKNHSRDFSRIYPSIYIL